MVPTQSRRISYLDPAAPPVDDQTPAGLGLQLDNTHQTSDEIFSMFLLPFGSSKRSPSTFAFLLDDLDRNGSTEVSSSLCSKLDR